MTQWHGLRELLERRRKIRRRIYKLITWTLVAIVGFLVAFIITTLVQAATWG